MKPSLVLDVLMPAQLKELVVELLGEVTALQQTVGQLRHEIARLNKQGVTFWTYLGSRLGIQGQPAIPALSDLIRCRGQAA